MRPTSRFLAPQLCLWKLRPTAYSPGCYQARQAKGSVEAEKAAAEKAKEGKRAPHSPHFSWRTAVRPYGVCTPLVPLWGHRHQGGTRCWPRARVRQPAPVVQLRGLRAVELSRNS